VDRRTKVVAGLLLAGSALAVTGTGLALAQDGGGDAAPTSQGSPGRGDDDRPLTADELEQATTAALAHTGGGRVTESEVDLDGPERFEVEVTLDDGTEVDLDLDESFAVVHEDRDRPDDGHDHDDDWDDDD
jgi:hypothetical protein